MKENVRISIYTMELLCRFYSCDNCYELWWCCKQRYFFLILLVWRKLICLNI